MDDALPIKVLTRAAKPTTATYGAFLSKIFPFFLTPVRLFVRGAFCIRNRPRTYGYEFKRRRRASGNEKSRREKKLGLAPHGGALFLNFFGHLLTDFLWKYSPFLFFFIELLK